MHRAIFTSCTLLGVIVITTDNGDSFVLLCRGQSIEKLTISDALLDKLSLCTRRRQTIERTETHQQQVRTLLDIVSRQPDSAFTQLLDALTTTWQDEAVTIISGDYKYAKKSTTSECHTMHTEDTGNRFNATKTAVNILRYG